jgi:tetratricopeptide (TPR) repeat protein
MRRPDGQGERERYHFSSMCGSRAPILLLTLIAARAMAATPAPRVTFYRQIAPIVYANCTPCHRPGESGPFSLVTYEDVRRHAQQVAAVTKRRFMPPWLPEPGHGDFAEERRLTDAQIQLIQAWVAEGAPAGSAAHALAPPKFSSEWQRGTPDLILRVAKPYQLYAEGSEVFWNFILPVPITTTRWVKAMEVRPGNPRVFHHANVILDRSGATRRQEAVPGAGFPGMDLTVEEETFDPDGHFLSWKPGSEPVVEPDGMAWRADPGMSLVLNVHLRPTGKPETISPEIGLYFTDKPQVKFPMLIQLEHDGMIDIPAGAKDFLVSDDFRIPIDVNVLEIYPHAHYLGKLLEGYATLPDGTRKWLIRIPDWDLGWQGVFRLKTPLLLPAGTVVSMRYHYDNTAANPRNPNRPPKEVRGGNQATDEMGHLWLQVLPVAEGDQRAVLQRSVVTQRLVKYPNDFGANFTMGDLLLSDDKPQEALPYFEKAAQANPRSVVGETELGIALFSAGKPADAEPHFKRALTLDASYTDARFDLASAEAANKEWEAAAADFKQVLTERADDAKAARHLGEVLLLWGDALSNGGKHQDALDRYRAALQFRPADPQLHGKIGMELAQMAHLDEAKVEFETALRIDPNSQPAKQGMQVLQAMKAQ